MHTHRPFKTASLLAAFCSMTLAAPTYAGFENNVQSAPNGSWDYTAANSNLTETVQAGITNVTVNSQMTSDADRLTLTATGGIDTWLRNANAADTAINIDGKVYLAKDTNSNCSFFGAWHSQLTNALTVNLVDADTLFDISSDKERVVAFYSDSDLLSSTMAGDIVITAGHDANNMAVSKAFYGSNITFDSIADTSSISVTSTGSTTYGLHATKNITITNQLAGDLSINGTVSTSGESAIYGMCAGNNINIGSIASTSDISVSGTGRRIFGLFTNDGDVTVSGNAAGSISINAQKSGESDADYATRIGSTNDVAAIRAKNLNNDANGGSVNMNGIYDGTINVNAGKSSSNQSEAYGIYATRDININSISNSANISVTATGNDVYAMYALNGITFNGNTQGSISAKGSNRVYAQRANTNITHNGVFADNIVVQATNGDAIAINAYNGTITCNEDVQANINSTANYFAIGFAANQGVHLLKDFTGRITTHASDHSAVAMRVYSGDINIDGNLAGEITSIANNNNAYGLYAKNINLNAITSTAKFDVATNGAEAYALYTNTGNINIANSLAGSMIIRSGKNGLNVSNASAIYSHTGTVSVNSIENNAIIDVYGTGTQVAGISAQSNVNVGPVAQTAFIKVKTDTGIAGGIISKAGTVSLTGSFAGTIDVTGPDLISGVVGMGGLNIADMRGTINLHSDGDHIFAIGSENWDGAKWISAPVSDLVTLSTGAQINGDIRLGNDANTGDEDTLTLRGSGNFNYDLHGVETIVVAADPNAPADSDKTWYLNGKSTPEWAGENKGQSNENDFKRVNRFKKIDVQDGLLGFGSLYSTDNLNVSANGGLAFNLDATDTDKAQLLVDEAATIAAGATIKANVSGALTEKTKFEILASYGTLNITGADATVKDLVFVPDTALIEYNAALSQDGKTLVITANPFADLQEYAKNPDFGAAKSLQNALDTDATGDINDIFDKFQDIEDEDELARELEKITPQQSAASASAAADTASAFARTLTVRTQSLGASPSGSSLTAADTSNAYPLMFSGPSFRDENGYEFWTSGFGSLSKQDDKNSTPGYQSKSAGTLIGLDRMTDNFIVGAALGIAHADIDSNHSRGSTDLDAFTAGAYFAYAPSNIKIEGGTVYTLGLSDYKRTTALNRHAEADDVTSHTFTNYLGASYDITSTDGRLVFIPNAQLAYTYFTQEGYGESKAGALNLDVDSFDNDILTATVGMKTSYKYSDNLKLNALLAYKYDFVNDAPTIQSSFQSAGSTPFKTTGAESDKNAIEIGAGFDYQINNRMKASLDYSYEHRDSLKTNNITVGFNILF